MPLLNNFGAVFTFAIQLEDTLHDYYQNLDDSGAAQAAKKRIDKLERARREYVVEITLEPIEDLDSDDYVLDTSDTTEAGRATIEDTMQRFYKDAAPKMNVRQAQRILEKCGKQFERTS